MSTVKDLPKVDRPREKLERYGAKKLSDHELLAIVLGSGIKGVNVIQLAKKIVAEVTKTGIDLVTLEQLIAIKGLGNIKAMQIISALEFGRRQFTKISEIIITPEKIFDLCSDIRNSRKEHFVVFYLNSRNVLIEREVVSVGTLNESLVHPREVFEPAIRLGAAAVVLAHNHPSGDVDPSQADIDITKKLVHSGKILDIRVVDHVIITSLLYKSIIENCV